MTTDIKRGSPRLIMAEGNVYKSISDAGRELGVHNSTIHQRITRGWQGYLKLPEGDDQVVYKEDGSAECTGKIVRTIGYKGSCIIMVRGEQARKLLPKDWPDRDDFITILREAYLVRGIDEGPYVPCQREEVEEYAEGMYGGNEYQLVRG